MKMIKTAGTFCVLAMGNFAGAASSSHNLYVNVPFAFVVAGRDFKPGAYRLQESDTGILTLQGAGGAGAVITTPAESSRPSETTGLRFTNSESRQYLVGVAVQGEPGRSIPEHLHERSVKQQHDLAMAGK